MKKILILVRKKIRFFQMKTFLTLIQKTNCFFFLRLLILRIFDKFLNMLFQIAKQNYLIKNITQNYLTKNVEKYYFLKNPRQYCIL